MTDLLPQATAILWRRLEDEPALAGFYLLGGTALALKINHRRSEDLDFAWPGSRLPRGRLDALVRKLESEEWSLERTDSNESYDEFLNAGMELHEGLRCLCSGKPRANDPGYDVLLSDPPSIEDMTEFFRVEIRDWKVKIAEQRLREAKGGE